MLRRWSRKASTVARARVRALPREVPPWAHRETVLESLGQDPIEPQRLSWLKQVLPLLFHEGDEQVVQASLELPGTILDVFGDAHWGILHAWLPQGALRTRTMARFSSLPSRDAEEYEGGHLTRDREWALTPLGHDPHSPGRLDGGGPGAHVEPVPIEYHWSEDLGEAISLNLVREEEG